MEWLYFLFGMIIWQIIRTIAIAINQAVIERRQKKFLKVVDIKFPDHTKVTLISVDSSDKRAMAKLERQLSDQYEYEDEEIRWRDSRGDQRTSERASGAVEGASGESRSPSPDRPDPPR